MVYKRSFFERIEKSNYENRTGDIDMNHTATFKWIEKIRNAMANLDAWEMDEQDRKTVFRCLQSELIESTERWGEQERTKNAGKKWQPEELQQLKTLLNGRIAKSWKEEQMNVTEAALVLRRTEKSIKIKAIEHGLGKAVEWNHEEYP